jgi:hypothetical protein
LQIPVFQNTSTTSSVQQGSLIYNRDMETLCVYTGDEWNCITGGNIISTDCLQAANSDNGLVLTPPLFLDKHGICRADGNAIIGNIEIPVDALTLVSPSNFDIIFESIGAGPNLLAQGANLFTVPSVDAYTNECLENWNMYVEVNVQGYILTRNGSVDTGIYIVKNGDFIESPMTTILLNGSFNLNSIIKCSPDDTIDIGVHANNFYGGGDSFLVLNEQIFLIGSNTKLQTTFKILGFESV